MADYTVSDGTNIYPLIEMEVKYTGTVLDQAQFTIANSYPLNTAITIYADTTVQFIGYVKDVEELDQGGLWKITAYEKAVELKTMPYLSSTVDIFTKTDTIYNLVNDALTSTPASGWTITTGMTEATSVTLNFYMVNRLQAVNKMLREMKGYYVIFDSATKKVKWLDATGINTDRSATNLTAANGGYIAKTVVSSSMLKGITEVVVIGQDSTIRGSYGSSTSSRIYYQVDDIKTSAEATAIATAIYGDIGVLYATYKVEVAADQIQYDVRDKVQVDGVMYWIRELTQAMDEISFIVDTGKISVVESLGSRIHLIEGNFPQGSDNSWSGGNSNVAANGVLETTYVFDVKDATMVYNAELDATISNFDKNVAAVTAQYLSDVDMIESSSAESDHSAYTDSFYIPASSSGATLTEIDNGYQHGMFVVSAYMVADVENLVTCVCRISYNGGSTWSTVGNAYATVRTTDYSHYTFVGMLSGSTTNESTANMKFRILITTASTEQLKAFGIYATVYRIPRHTHVVTTTDNRVTAANTPASTVFVKLNSGGTYTEVTPGTPVALSTLGTLATGKNTIYVKTPATSTTNMCSVNPTISYQSLKS